jgi:hypothetical protein
MRLIFSFLLFFPVLFYGERPLFVFHHLSEKAPQALLNLATQLEEEQGIPKEFIVIQQSDECRAETKSLWHVCFDRENKGEVLVKRLDVLSQSFQVFEKIQKEKHRKTVLHMKTKEVNHESL